MNALTRPIDPQSLVNEIQSARLRLARAESKWELADEQARAAKRRRKEAKQAARRAKKQARQAGKEFTAAKEGLALAEEKFAAAVERAARHRKLTLARLAAKAKAAPTQRKLPAPVPARAAIKTAGRKVTEIGAPSRVQAPRSKPISVPRDFESPPATPTPAPAGHAPIAQAMSVGPVEQPKAAAGNQPRPSLSKSTSNQVEAL